jgi:hypothetical protein
MEGMDSYATPVAPKEKEPLTDEELVQSALTYSLDGEALALFSAMQSPYDTQESFRRWVEDFNARPKEERGFDKYDHSRPLTAHIDRTIERTTSKGYPYTITQHKNGEITIESKI